MALFNILKPAELQLLTTNRGVKTSIPQSCIHPVLKTAMY